LGGIYEYSKTGSTQGVPGLKDLPLVGWLFKSKTKAEDRKELLIFITPRIITPMAKN
jgi:type IV pilus assembly protein PilQ